MISRATLRKQLRQKRRSLSASQQQRAARNLYHQLVQQPCFYRAKHIALYLANDGEISPEYLINSARKQRKLIYLPVLERWPKQQMSFQRIEANTPLIPNKFGILEPKKDLKKQRKPWALDLILLPLVGFDYQGNRLGMGGGFYDRCLAYQYRRNHWNKPILLGLAHHNQQVDHLPVQSWDIPLDAIATDLQFINVKP
ncbi:UNVERIFIED_CONTAM: hypothetical protein GTU68_035416 [Idotea baltica]|nr:hypothetical protein [Idotea baltica]